MSGWDAVAADLFRTKMNIEVVQKTQDSYCETSLYILNSSISSKLFFLEVQQR
jgi:hypothetical protein